MIIDCLLKNRYYIPYTIDKNGTITKSIAQLLAENVWKLYHLLWSLTLDRDPQFISGVWKNFYKILGIFVNLSTIFHSKTDKQSEIINHEIKKYFCIFFNYLQDE